MKRITVLLAEDHMIVREGLRALLEAEDDIEVVGEAENGRQAVALASKLRPDVVVMDIAMPLLNGLEATRQILKAAPATKVLMLSAHSDDAYVEQVMALGAVGIPAQANLRPRVCPRRFGKSTRATPSSAPPFPSACDDHDQKSHDRGGPAREESRPPDLARDGGAPTDRRRQGQQGNRGGTAASASRPSRSTGSSLMEKLNIHDTAGLTRYAIATGIIESSVQVTIV